jgi:hypothetical protein
MIKSFKNNRTPNTSLSWDDYYPRSYTYKRSKEIQQLMAKIEEIRKENP